MNFRILATSVGPRGRILALLAATALAVTFAVDAQAPVHAQAPAPAPGAPAPAAPKKAAPKAAPKAPAAPAAQAPAQQPPASQAQAPGASWGQLHQAELDNSASQKGLKLVWFSTGSDDGLITTSKSTVEVLKKHGFNPVFKESPGGHTWINWRNYLNEFAPQLFQ